MIARLREWEGDWESESGESKIEWKRGRFREFISVGNKELEDQTIQIQRIFLQYKLIPEFSKLGYNTIQYSSPGNSSTKWHFLIPKYHVRQCYDGIENKKSDISSFSFKTVLFYYKFYEKVVFDHFHHNLGLYLWGAL